MEEINSNKQVEIITNEGQIFEKYLKERLGQRECETCYALLGIFSTCLFYIDLLSPNVEEYEKFIKISKKLAQEMKNLVKERKQ